MEVASKGLKFPRESCGRQDEKYAETNAAKEETLRESLSAAADVCANPPPPFHLIYQSEYWSQKPSASSTY